MLRSLEENGDGKICGEDCMSSKWKSGRVWIRDNLAVEARLVSITLSCLYSNSLEAEIPRRYFPCFKTLFTLQASLGDFLKTGLRSFAVIAKACEMWGVEDALRI